jgi:cytoskeletal protein CcmA (bactofilin family)
MGSRNDSISPESPDSSEEQTLFTTSLVVEGDLSAAEDLLIEGEIKGKILIPGHQARIAKAGRVMGEVLGKSIIVEGNVAGDLHASEKVILRRLADVRGKIIAARVVLEEGCKFNGRIQTDAAAASAALARGRKQITAALLGKDLTVKHE